ncbi:hypothetical protein [Sphingorhabdus sp. EL138]|uniref:hypothetical protein n=1 Tax=Sphingorhabdus sp. EL138 TaxID=2073156 RepID=UPI0025D06722|nr:hypothetical protein [Sphingorhabdus sp. EL138]
MRKQLWLAAFSAGALMVSGCSLGTSTDESPSTLYRNSPLDYGMRVHFATFDTGDTGDFNLQNCAMTARILNFNLDSANKAEGTLRDPRLGFWCELGPYAAKGVVPDQFESELPTVVRSKNSW